MVHRPWRPPGVRTPRFAVGVVRPVHEEVEAVKVCPECLESPAPEQRDGIAKDGRCRRCLRELAAWTRYMKEALL